MASPKSHKHAASGRKFFEVEFGHGGTFIDGTSIDQVGKLFTTKNRMDCKVRPAKMVPGKGLEGTGKFKTFKTQAMKAIAADSYNLTDAEMAKVKKLAKTTNIDWKTIAARPERARAWIAEYEKHGTINGVKVKASQDKVWVAKSPKGGNVTDDVASKALEKYIAQFGSRGKLALYEAESKNGMVSFGAGCRMFKGTIKEIVAQLKEQAIATAASGSSISVPKEARETANAIKSACLKAGSGSIDIMYDKDGPEWRVTVKDPQTLGLDVKYLYIVSTYGTTPEDREVSVVLPGRTIVLVDDTANSLPQHKRDLGRLLLSCITDAFKAIGQMSKTAQASVAVAEDSSVPNKVAGQIYGDAKAIAAKLKSWKKSMSADEYKVYETYQKSQLKNILTQWLPKLSKEYQEKIKAI